jgi:hypothetical protein
MLGAIVGLHLLGGFLRANAARRAARMTAAQARRNAMLSEMAAGDAADRGQIAEGEARLATSGRVASDQAQLASAGVDVKSGSALDILSSQRGRGELIAQRARSNALREAWGYKTKAEEFRMDAAYADQTGDQAFVNEILGGGLSAAGSYTQGQGGAGVAYPVLRIGEPTTFERPSYSSYSEQGV